MKHARILFFLLLLPVLPLAAQPSTAQGTIKDRMDRIEQVYQVHFVYDAALPVGNPTSVAVDSLQSLKQNLARLFDGTEIRWQIKKRYVVLTRAKTVQKPDSLQMSESPLLPASPALKDYLMADDTLVAASITGHIDRDMNFTQTGLTKLDGAAFRRAFATLSSPDVLKTLQALPGVASGTELLSNLYVHGGDGSDNLFLLDGAPLYQICHFGGVFSAFNTDAISSLDFYKSGFPARFGGRTSSVVDITTREGDYTAYHGTFSLGLLDGRVQLEGPVASGKTSFNVAMRRTWADPLIWAACWISNRNADNKYWYKYAFTDLNAKVSHKFSESSRLSANFYMGNDRFEMKEIDALFAFKLEGTQYFDQYQEQLRLRWGNVLASVDWKKEFSDRVQLHLIGYGSSTRSLFRADVSSTYYSSSGTKLGEFLDWTTDRGLLDDLGISANVNWNPASGHHVRFGTGAILHGYRPAIAYEIDRKGNRDSLRQSAFEWSVYAEDEFRLGSRVTANAGLRNTVYASAGRVWNSLEPRLALKVQCTPFLNFKASYATMSQFSHQASTMYLDLPTSKWLPSGVQIPPMRSQQVAGGLYARLPHAMHLNVEGWWKRMDNLIEYDGKNSYFVQHLDGWETFFRTGKGRSFGMEFDFGYEMPVLSVNAFYTLSWSERLFVDIWPSWYPDRNDNRHKITLQANWRINEKWELYSAWNYHSGNRMTLATQYVPGFWTSMEPRPSTINHETGETLLQTEDYWAYESPNNFKIPDYHRLDIGFNLHRITRRGNESVWNFSIYNVYCRMNPLYCKVVRKGKEDIFDVSFLDLGTVSFVGKGYGYIPIVPTVSYTLKF